MLRAKFFYNFFKSKQNRSTEVVKYNSNVNFDLEEKINNQLIKINEEISENSKALLEAQIVKLRSNFSKSNNLIERIGRNVYKTKLEESINWHQKQIKDLYLRRRELNKNLDKLQGTFWLNRIKRFLTIILIGFFALFTLFIFLSGFMVIIYCLPLIIIIFAGYLLINKKY